MVQKHPYRTRHKEDFEAGRKENIPPKALEALEKEAKEQRKSTPTERPEKAKEASK